MFLTNKTHNFTLIRLMFKHNLKSLVNQTIDNTKNNKIIAGWDNNSKLLLPVK